MSAEPGSRKSGTAKLLAQSVVGVVTDHGINRYTALFPRRGMLAKGRKSLARDLLGIGEISRLFAAYALGHLTYVNRNREGHAVFGIAGLPLIYLHYSKNVYIYMWLFSLLAPHTIDLQILTQNGLSV